MGPGRGMMDRAGGQRGGEKGRGDMETQKMKEVRLKAMAKINLGLDVLRRRDDGYHELRMIMQTVTLSDRITLRRIKGPDIRIQTNLGFLPADDSNLAVRAARLLCEEHGITDGIFIDLEKRIPVAAGLAGGSSDAAAVLVGINRMFELGHTTRELMERGLKLGADVPFCVLRGTALAEGVGEVLTSLRPMPGCFIVLAKPGSHVSTKAVFQALRTDEIREHPQIGLQMEALEKGNLVRLSQAMGNVLEAVTIPMCPEIGNIREQMLRCGALGARMSGSGPTVFGIFESEADARAACDVMRTIPEVKQVFLTQPYRPYGKAGG